MGLPKVNPFTGVAFKDEAEALAWFENQKTDQSEFHAYVEQKRQEAEATKALKTSATNKVKSFFVNTVGLTAAEADAYFE